MTRKKTRKTHHKGPAPTPGASPSASMCGDARTGETQRSPSHSTATGVFGVGSRRNALATLALGLLVAVSYFPATQAGFVWDDFIVVTSKAVREWSGLWQFWFDPYSTYMPGNTDEDHYWPLLYTTFWLEHKLWGFAPTGYHLVNLVLHFVNTLLVWRIMWRLAVPGAWLVAAVFAVHPVHVEAAVWVIARKDLLAAVFYLTAVLTWLRFIESPRPGRYVLALTLFVAGLLSKSIVITLPVALLLLHWWQQGRVTGTDFLRLLPFFLVGLGIAVADMVFIANRKVVVYDYTMVERVLIAAHSLWFYVGKLLWPTDLATIYPRWEGFAALLSWGYVIAAGATAALLWFLRQRVGRGPLAGTFFFAVTLSPVLCLVDYSYMQFTFVADRYQYLASIGVMAVLIAGAARAADKLPGAWSKASPGLAVLLLVVLGVMTWQQAGIYRDEVTFFRHLVAINPRERAIHLHLGKALFELNPSDAGRAAPKEKPASIREDAAARGAPKRPDRLAEAEHHYRRALEIDPRYTSARQNLAELFRQQHRYEEAIVLYRAVIEADPGFALAQAGMGTALLNLQRHAEAIESLARAVSLQPDLPMAHSLLILMGRASQQMGQPDTAAQYYARAVKSHPRDAEALDLLAGLRFGQQRYAEALDLYRTLIDVQPDNATAYANLGAVLYHLGRASEALESFERALSLDAGLESARVNRDLVRKAMSQGGR